MSADKCPDCRLERTPDGKWKVNGQLPAAGEVVGGLGLERFAHLHSDYETLVARDANTEGV